MLRKDYAWVREFELQFFATPTSVELIVEGNDENESIADEQRTAFLQLGRAVHVAEREIYKHYLNVSDDYRARFGADANSRMPRIQSQDELGSLVKLTGIIFPMVMTPGEVTTGFLLECSWEPEAGLGVKITNGEVEVGGQDILT
ncbi:MAG: hypothetical protein KC910_19875 [Candidatus Eremiobacteraeota bacterium]|nr:hypothetical protein [Candidatus Eremiobacteraeota bacterium]